MIPRLKTTILDYRGVVTVVAFVALAKFVVGGWAMKDWYLIPFSAMAYGVFAMVAWFLTSLVVNKLYGLSYDSTKDLLFHPRVCVVVILLVIALTEYHLYNRRVEEGWVARCVRTRDWEASGESYPADPVDWCLEYLAEAKAESDYE